MTSVQEPGADGIMGTADDIVTFGNQATPTNAAASGATIPGLAQSLFIPNITPDAGLSAPANSFFTFFGQFFDHGLDLISKDATNGTIFIPLSPDDPLYVPGAPTNFMVADARTGPARPRRDHRHRGRRSFAHQPDLALRRSEPDLWLGPVAPGVSARVHDRCGRESAFDRCAARPSCPWCGWRLGHRGRPEGHHGDVGRPEGQRPDQLWHQDHRFRRGLGAFAGDRPLRQLHCRRAWSAADRRQIHRRNLGTGRRKQGHPGRSGPPGRCCRHRPRHGQGIPRSPRRQHVPDDKAQTANPFATSSGAPLAADTGHRVG